MRKLFLVLAVVVITAVVAMLLLNNRGRWFVHYENGTGGYDYNLEIAPSFVFGNPPSMVLRDPTPTEGTDWQPSARKMTGTFEFGFAEDTMFVVGKDFSYENIAEADIGDFEWAVTVTNSLGFKEVVYTNELPRWLWQDEPPGKNVLVISEAKVFWVARSNDSTQTYLVPYAAYEEYYVHVSNSDLIRIDRIYASDWGLCRQEWRTDVWGACR